MNFISYILCLNKNDFKKKNKKFQVMVGEKASEGSCGRGTWGSGYLRDAGPGAVALMGSPQPPGDGAQVRQGGCRRGHFGEN